jgi:hypothetical protein
MIKKVKQITQIILSVAIALPLSLRAQDSTSAKTRTFHLAFITPLSSNGLNSGNITNKFSINLLAGYSGGLDGAEFSGLGSVLIRNMNGAQFAGLGNIVLGDANGAQFAGLTNITSGKFKGFQTSGLANINADTSKGFQLAGLVNYTPGDKVSQMSGLASITTGNNKGFQLSGLANVHTGRLKGTQVAGLFNYAGKLSGVQVGVFNCVDSLEKGVPIGFLSFVKNGYTAFEAGATETLYGVMSFKTGTRQFYNILSVGGGSRNGYSLFAWGYGLGAFIPVGQKAGISIDGICYQVNEGEWFTERFNLLNKLNLTGSWRLANHLSVFAGISWNVTVSDITDVYGDLVTPNIAPWSVFDETYDGHVNVQMYPGFSAGIRL